MMKYDPNLDRRFALLSDGARREIVTRLARGPASVSELAAAAGLSLPSAHAHLAKLAEADLIDSEKQGRTRICRLNPGAIAPARDWLDAQANVWSARLDQFEAYATDLARSRKDTT